MAKQRLANTDTHNYTYKGTKSSGAFAYYFQRISGGVLTILLFLHYYMMHSTTMGGHSHQETVERLSMWEWQVFYLSFVFLGMYHGLNGIWNIAQDYNMSPRVRMLVYTFLVIIGIAFSAVAAITIITVPLKFA